MNHKIIRLHIIQHIICLISLSFFCGCTKSGKFYNFNEKKLLNKPVLELLSNYYDFYKQKRFTEISIKQYEKCLSYKGVRLDSLSFYVAQRIKLKPGLSREELVNSIGEPIIIIKENTHSDERYYYGYIDGTRIWYTGVIDIEDGKVLWWGDYHGIEPNAEYEKKAIEDAKNKK